MTAISVYRVYSNAITFREYRSYEEAWYASEKLFYSGQGIARIEYIHRVHIA